LSTAFTQRGKEASEMLFFTKRKNPPYPGISPPSGSRIDRKHDRITYETPITYENYETKEITHGSLHNYSKGGLYVEVAHCPAIGTGALIYMDDYSPNAAGPENLKNYHVLVRWVKPISKTKGQNRYGIGVRHCRDVEELFRLFGH
jgi:hypothetical protein